LPVAAAPISLAHSSSLLPIRAPPPGHRRRTSSILASSQRRAQSAFVHRAPCLSSLIPARVAAAQSASTLKQSTMPAPHLLSCCRRVHLTTTMPASQPSKRKKKC
jgi:hypothetical protein